MSSSYRKSDYVVEVIMLRWQLHALRKTPKALLPDSHNEVYLLRRMTIPQLKQISDRLLEAIRFEKSVSST